MKRGTELEFQLIRAQEFIRLDVHEHLDFEASKKALQGLVFACRKRDMDRALLDLRSLPVLPEPHFTPDQIMGLVATFLEAGFSRHQRLAVLYQADPHHGIRAFAFVNRLRGLNVRAFADFEEALVWLSQGQNRPRAGERAEVPHPIPVHKPKLRQKPGSFSCALRTGPENRVPEISSRPVRDATNRLRNGQ